MINAFILYDRAVPLRVRSISTLTRAVSFQDRHHKRAAFSTSQPLAASNQAACPHARATPGSAARDKQGCPDERLERANPNVRSLREFRSAHLSAYQQLRKAR